MVSVCEKCDHHGCVFDVVNEGEDKDTYSSFLPQERFSEPRNYVLTEGISLL